MCSSDLNVVRWYGTATPLGRQGRRSSRKPVYEISIDVHRTYAGHVSDLAARGETVYLFVMSHTSRDVVLPHLSDRDYVMNGITYGTAMTTEELLCSFGGLSMNMRPRPDECTLSELSVLLTDTDHTRTFTGRPLRHRRKCAKK